MPRLQTAGRRYHPLLEVLEDRLVPTLNPSAREQYMLELVNRMRTNPAAELPLLLNSNDQGVNDALAIFNVDRTVLAQQWATLTPVAPLAWNEVLWNTARAHSDLMNQFEQQSHQLPGEADIGTRIPAAGYTNWSNLGENIAHP